MKNVVIIGGGVAGMQAAVTLASNGIKAVVVEKEDRCGGKLNSWYRLAPTMTPASDVVDDLAQRLIQGGIETKLATSVVAVEQTGVRTAAGDLIQADAVIAATGFDLFDASLKEEYGFGVYENVITTAQLEEQLRSNGSLLTKQGQQPQRVAFVHCVGSRDAKVCQEHCSRLCCITAVKQAIELREMMPQTEIYCFYMDIRMFGPLYEEIYRQAQEQYNVHFVRGRVSEAGETLDRRIQVKAEDTLVGRPLKITVDMLVLAVGMKAGGFNRILVQKNEVNLYKSGFVQPRDMYYNNVCSEAENLFYAGAITAPKSVGEAMNEGTAAAMRVIEYLKQR